MATSSTNERLQKAKSLLNQANEAYVGEKWKKADALYTKAFDEFRESLKLHRQNADSVKAILNSGSTTAVSAPDRADSLPKLCPVKTSGVKLNGVGGLKECKRVLEEATIWPKKYPQFFTGNRKPWRAVLLYGPPGTGKTLLAEAIAAEAEYSFFRISPSDIVSKWMGDSEKQVKSIFREAREKRPSIVFIDEIDSLCGKRGVNTDNEASQRIKSELLVRMQEVCDGEERVLILAATNIPSALDQAIRRRFDKRIYVRLPDKEARKHIFKVKIGKTPKNISEEEFDDLVKDTAGLSGSDISYFVKDALYEVVREIRTIDHFKKKDGKWVPCQHKGKDGKWVPCQHKEKGCKTLQEIDEEGQNSKIEVPPCTVAHFEKVRESQKATVTQYDLKEFDKFTKKFGIKG